jgi:hypothetical protein
MVIRTNRNDEPQSIALPRKSLRYPLPPFQFPRFVHGRASDLNYSRYPPEPRASPIGAVPYFASASSSSFSIARNFTGSRT